MGPSRAAQKPAEAAEVPAQPGEPAAELAEPAAEPLDSLFELPAQAGVVRAEVRRWSLALARLEEAERRGVAADVLQIFDEAVIAARVAMLRAADRAGTLDGLYGPAERRQLERDKELLRRFPADRAGDDGVGWFDWPSKP